MTANEVTIIVDAFNRRFDDFEREFREYKELNIKDVAVLQVLTDRNRKDVDHLALKLREQAKECADVIQEKVNVANTKQEGKITKGLLFALIGIIGSGLGVLGSYIKDMIKP